MRDAVASQRKEWIPAASASASVSAARVHGASKALSHERQGRTMGMHGSSRTSQQISSAEDSSSRIKVKDMKGMGERERPVPRSGRQEVSRGKHESCMWSMKHGRPLDQVGQAGKREDSFNSSSSGSFDEDHQDPRHKVRPSAALAVELSPASEQSPLPNRALFGSPVTPSRRRELEANDTGDRIKCPVCQLGMDHWKPAQRQQVGRSKFDYA